MGWKSLGVVGFDLGPLLQSQTWMAKINSTDNSVIRVPRGCSVTPTYRKSWAKNHLIWSDFTLGSSFKVKRCWNGFAEFSFWWIQFALVL